MQDEHSFRAIPRPTLERLPKYLNYLRGKSAEGLLTTSSTAIAQAMHLSPIQVRKDLAFVTSGKPRVGHDTQQLIERLEHFLRCDSTHDAVLVGAGHLGKALLSYEGFGRYRLQILAAFDADETLVGTTIHGKPVFPMHKLANLTARLNAFIGIITVPAEGAQSVCDELVKGGVRGTFAVPQKADPTGPRRQFAFRLTQKRLLLADDSNFLRSELGKLEGKLLQEPQTPAQLLAELTAHLLQQGIFAIRIDADSIDQGEFVILPFAVRVHAVARYARRILHNGNAAARHFVEKRALADVGPPNNRNQWLCHMLIPPKTP